MVERQESNTMKNMKDLKKTISQSADYAVNSMTDAVGPVQDSVAGIAKQDFTELLSSTEKVTLNKDTRAKLFERLCAFIPGKVNNAAIITAFEVMRKQQRLMKKDFSRHLKKNKEAVEAHAADMRRNQGYVEDQNKWTDASYGESTMQYSGCEVFATFNAIWSLLGKTIMSLPEMISEYEKDGMVLSGKFGTSPKAISDFLEKHGFKTELVTNEKEFDDVGKRSDSLILTMYNDKDDISQEVHTVNISKKDKKYTAHNVYCNGKVLGPFDSVSETIRNINQGKAKGISLIGIKQKKKV